MHTNKKSFVTKPERLKEITAKLIDMIQRMTDWLPLVLAFILLLLKAATKYGDVPDTALKYTYFIF